MDTLLPWVPFTYCIHGRKDKETFLVNHENNGPRAKNCIFGIATVFLIIFGKIFKKEYRISTNSFR